MDIPVNKATQFNENIPAAGDNFLTADIVPLLDAGIIRIYLCLSIAGIVTVKRTYQGVSVNEVLNQGAALVAGASYVFTIPWRAGESINLTCSTPSIAGSQCADNTGTCTASPVTLAIGANTITVTGAGTFDITLPAGVSGTAASGTATLAGSPVTLPAGATTTVNTGATTGNFTITITAGKINKLQIDEAWS